MTTQPGKPETAHDASQWRVGASNDDLTAFAAPPNPWILPDHPDRIPLALRANAHRPPDRYSLTDTPYKLPDGLNLGWRDGYRVTFIAADGNTRTGICHQVGDRYVIEADNPVERATETITRMEGVIRAITEETE